MKIFKYIISIILAFLLMLSILLTVALQIVSTTILNKDYILGKLDEANYYNNVYEQIKDSLAENRTRLLKSKSKKNVKPEAPDDR